VAKDVEIRPLARDDDRAGFSCGQADIDRFFEHYSGQNQFKLHLAVTYVAVVEGRIAGFATVAASSLEAVSFYKGLGFVPLEGVREGLLAVAPMPMFLAIDSIVAAAAG
jgi:hypothetical protein